MIRILIVDDQPQIRRGLIMRLELEPEFQIVGEAGDGDTAARMAEILSPNLILLDLEMPGLDGIATTIRIHERLPGCSIVLLSLREDAEIRRTADR